MEIVFQSFYCHWIWFCRTLFISAMLFSFSCVQTKYDFFYFILQEAYKVCTLRRIHYVAFINDEPVHTRWQIAAQTVTVCFCVRLVLIRFFFAIRSERVKIFFFCLYEKEIRVVQIKTERKMRSNTFRLGQRRYD